MLDPASKVRDREFIGAFLLALIRPHCSNVDGGGVSIKGELASWHSTFGWRRLRASSVTKKTDPDSDHEHNGSNE